MKPAALFFAILLSAVALAASPVGTWTGKFNVKALKVPANTPPAQRAMVAKMAAQMKSGRLMLTLKADHTYAVKAVGLPFTQAGAGTWSQKGEIVTTKANRPGAKPQTTALSKDGRHMTIVLPHGQGTIVFTR